MKTQSICSPNHTFSPNPPFTYPWKQPKLFSSCQEMQDKKLEFTFPILPHGIFPNIWDFHGTYRRNSRVYVGRPYTHFPTFYYEPRDTRWPCPWNEVTSNWISSRYDKEATASRCKVSSTKKLPNSSRKTSGVHLLSGPANLGFLSTVQFLNLPSMQSP